MKRYRYLLPVLIICAILGFTIVKNLTTGGRFHTDSAMLMDTVVEISVWGSGRVEADAAVGSALRAMARVDSLFGGGMVDARTPAEVAESPEFGYLMDVSRRVHDVTGGLFDPTIGSVSRLWEFWQGAEPPPVDSIRSGLANVGLDDYVSGRDTDRFVLDLGGIAKGYAVDLATEILRALGFKSAIINAGGDLGLIGKRLDGHPFRIAIRHPRVNNSFIGYLDLEDVCVATSGDYERCFVVGGVRYHHILDPRTGMPGHGAASVTVVASRSCLGDALATGLFLLGAEEGLRVVEELEGVEAVFVFAEGESVAVSSGLIGKFGRYEPE